MEFVFRLHCFQSNSFEITFNKGQCYILLLFCIPTMSRLILLLSLGPTNKIESLMWVSNSRMYSLDGPPSSIAISPANFTDVPLRGSNDVRPNARRVPDQTSSRCTLIIFLLLSIYNLSGSWKLSSSSSTVAVLKKKVNVICLCFCLLCCCPQ